MKLLGNWVEKMDALNGSSSEILRRVLEYDEFILTVAQISYASKSLNLTSLCRPQEVHGLPEYLQKSLHVSALFCP